MRQILLTIIFLLSFSFCFSQNLNKNYLNNWLKMYDTSFTADPNILYVIDGLIYGGRDTTTLNNKLAEISIQELFSVERLKVLKNSYHSGPGVILVTLIGNQTKKEKKELLQKAKEKFNDCYTSSLQQIFMNAKNPSLYIDLKPIHHTETKQSIQKLQLKDIYAIDIIEKPVPAALWGQNAKNGLVRIWTRKNFDE